jgi:uncharacterized protein YjiS (DUF1127 family)
MKQKRAAGEVLLLHLLNRLHCVPTERRFEMVQHGNTVEEVWGGLGVRKSQFHSAAALLQVAAAMAIAARRLRAAAKALDAWLERRRLAAAAFHDLGGMSERELKDIGLTRVDVWRVAQGASLEIHNRT